MIEPLARRQVALLGAGHTNAHILRMWAMDPIPDASLTCISDFSVATYSGMLPAVLAGQKPPAAMEIDLVKLCASVGARLIRDPVSGIDPATNELRFRDRPSIPFDVLSVGIGSVPNLGTLTAGAEKVLLIKPMQTFLRRLGDAVAAVQNRPACKVVVVGGGVAGTEISFCLVPFLRQFSSQPFTVQLVTRGSTILPEATAGARRKVEGEFRRQGIDVSTGLEVTAVGDHEVTLSDGSKRDADLVIWATGATAPPLLASLDLPTDDRGFLLTDATLKSTSGRPVFAVGDSGTVADESIPKAGVFAVRQGPVLWGNIRRFLGDQPLKTYQPQRSFLKLINLGDGRAVGQWKGLSFSGRWVMRLKDEIDSRFMEKHRPQPMAGDDDANMQCRGCGCKLGGDLLGPALDRYQGEVSLEDAALVSPPDSVETILASTDFFSSPFDDAYLSGRIAALHSASDLWVSGAAPQHALANVVVPEGDPAAQRRLLQDLHRGAAREFEAMGASIVGGHTIVGPRFEVGFTVIGSAIGPAVIRKSNLRAGDQLLLTKPLGIGVLLAAHSRLKCAATDYDRLIETMLAPQREFANLAVKAGVVAGTDVTGFGLAGHLIEMLDGSSLSATVMLQQIPLISGAAQAFADGIESSLAPANRSAERQIIAEPTVRQDVRFSALFDPQTCGGFLLGCGADVASQYRRLCDETGLDLPAVIGEVTANEGSASRLQVV